jgi:predicted glycoside hydrolase/deacetylase ChbG (UPF0249 family)
MHVEAFMRQRGMPLDFLQAGRLRARRMRPSDAGMSHSVNMALERLIETGLPVSVSVMFPCPWYQETVEMLKRHPSVSIGIHLTLN